MDGKFKAGSVFFDNMMLQRNRIVPVWGFGPEGNEVTACFNGQAKRAVVQNGRWEVDFDPMDVVSEGLPMTLTCGKDSIRLGNVLVGDVWIAAGQSNMCFYVDYLQPETRNAIVNDYEYPQIRFFREKELLNAQPQEETTEGRWIVGKPSDIGTCPTVGALFARGIHKEMHIPIGILTVAYGGVRIETFIKEQTLKESGLPVHLPTSENAYNAMIHPIIPYACCGMIWYQGEANCDSAEHRQYYHQYMKLLVEQMRREFRNPDMPVYQVQLPSYGGADADYTEIRFEQMKAETVVPNLYTTVNYDTGLPNEIHPSDKLPIGARLASMGLEQFYGKDVKKQNRYPAFESAKVEGKKVLVTFKEVGEGLQILDNAVNGLELCGKDGRYYPAEAEVIGFDRLLVKSDKVSCPAGIRYACKSYMIPVQFMDKNGNPVKPFRAEI